MTKLKIDFQLGVLEVEGEESFVKEVYQDYKNKVIFASGHTETRKVATQAGSQEQVIPKESKKRSKVRGRSSRESHSPIKDLDLSSKKNSKSLRDFYKEKAPFSAMESNAVFVYYLQKIANAKNINADHVYSCYKDVSARVPTALNQSLLDTSHRKGWIDTSSMENILIAIPGENLVENDLPRKEKDKKD